MRRAPPEAALPEGGGRHAIALPFPDRDARADLADQAGRSGGGPRGTATRLRPDGNLIATLALVAVVCLLTYVLLPLLKPVIDLSGGVGPVLGLVIGAVSATAIVFSMRRFWRANHRMRWAYTVVGGGILVLLAIQAVGDIAALF